MSLLKAVLWLLIPAALVSAQPFGVGIKLGVPVTDAFSVVQNPSQTLTETHHYTVGGYGELRLPAGLALEVDALYRTYEVQGSSASAWEFPVLVKHRILPGPIKPYFDAGLSFSHLSDINVSSLQHLANFGVVVGGGVELKVLSMRMGPEVRYTGWWFHNFDGPVQTNRNQLEVLFGVGF